ncbi:hypothetical protein CAEBREN_13868 [Caenorhabditis brenneri]|uniref:Uncharacterized protein n=1 Tax=Caenorhabditis brenneri TaxID=135651 RepID=G0PKM7_CAEBE|nr:hypothetical protein CAEBREN_13868 [Caenorhabditis brenneri]
MLSLTTRLVRSYILIIRKLIDSSYWLLVVVFSPDYLQFLLFDLDSTVYDGPQTSQPELQAEETSRNEDGPQTSQPELRVEGTSRNEEWNATTPNDPTAMDAPAATTKYTWS